MCLVKCLVLGSGTLCVEAGLPGKTVKSRSRTSFSEWWLGSSPAKPLLPEQRDSLSH